MISEENFAKTDKKLLKLLLNKRKIIRYVALAEKLHQFQKLL